MSFTTSYAGNELKFHATGCLDITDCETGTIWYGERPEPSLSINLDIAGRGDDSSVAVEETWDMQLQLLKATTQYPGTKRFVVQVVRS